MRYRVIDRKNGQIIEADKLKDIVEFMEFEGLTDTDIEFDINAKGDNI